MAIINAKIKTGEFLCPTNLPRAWAFVIYELPKFVLISKNEDLVFTAFQIMVLSLIDLNNSQELLIVDFIPSFYTDCLLREKNYWVLLANLANIFRRF